MTTLSDPFSFGLLLPIEAYTGKHGFASWQSCMERQANNKLWSVSDALRGFGTLNRVFWTS